MIDLLFGVILIALGIVSFFQSLSPYQRSSTALGSGISTRSIADKPASIRTTQGYRNATWQQSYGGTSTCIYTSVPVNVSATNVKYDFQAPNTTRESVQSLISLAKNGSTLITQIENGTHIVNDVYSIFTSLCLPPGKPVPNAVHFLTNGLGFDHAYWDIPGYSYVDAATAAGYAVFSYDRLGSGLSSKPDPVQIVQRLTHVAVGKELLRKLRDGHFTDSSFSQVAAVGHSYGGLLTETIVSESPELVDAAVLTGFSVDFSGIGNFLMALNLDLARYSNSSRFVGSAPGYLLASSAIAWQTGLFTAPSFDEQVLQSSFQNASTITFGELFSTTGVTTASTSFKGPIIIVNGDSDLPMCSGNCTYPPKMANDALKTAFGQSKSATSYVLPNTGHVLNLHHAAGQVYERILDYLESNGIRAVAIANSTRR